MKKIMKKIVAFVSILVAIIFGSRAIKIFVTAIVGVGSFLSFVKYVL